MRSFLVVFLFTVANQVFAAPTVNLSLSNDAYNVGDTVTVDVVMTDFPRTHGGGINLSYDPKVVNVQNVSIDGTWSFVNKAGAIDNSAGQVTDIIFTSITGEEGDALPVAKITMQVVGAGDPNIIASEASTNPFVDTNGRISVVFNNISSPTSVSEATDETDTPLADNVNEIATQAESTTVASTNNSASASDYTVINQDAISESVSSSSNQVATSSSSSSGIGVIKLPSGQESISVPVVDDSNSNDRQFSSDSSNQQQAVADSAGIVINTTGSNSKTSVSDNAGNVSRENNPVILASSAEQIAAEFVEESGVSLPTAPATEEESVGLRQLVLTLVVVFLIFTAGYFVKIRIFGR